MNGPEEIWALIQVRYYQDSVTKSLISLCHMGSYLFSFSSFKRPMCLLSHSFGRDNHSTSLPLTTPLPQAVSFSYTYTMCPPLHPSPGHGPGLLHSIGSCKDLNATGGLVDSLYPSYPHFKNYHILQWAFIVCLQPQLLSFFIEEKVYFIFLGSVSMEIEN